MLNIEYIGEIQKIFFVFKIKKAISRFISNTQKIVQKVKPEAKVIIPKKKLIKKKLNPSKMISEENEEQATNDLNLRVIHIPDFNGKL